MFSLQKFRPMCSLSNNVKLTTVIYSRFVSTTIVQMPRTSTFLVRCHSKNTSSYVPNTTYYIPSLRNMSTDKPTNISIKERMQDFIDFILSDPIVNFVCCIVLITWLFNYGQEEAVKNEFGEDITAKLLKKDD